MVAASRALGAKMYPLRYGGLSGVRNVTAARGLRAARPEANVDMLGRKEIIRPHRPYSPRLRAAG